MGRSALAYVLLVVVLAWCGCGVHAQGSFEPDFEVLSFLPDNEDRRLTAKQAIVVVFNLPVGVLCTVWRSHSGVHIHVSVCVCVRVGDPAGCRLQHR